MRRFKVCLGAIDGRSWRWGWGWGVCGGSLSCPGMCESPRQQTHWPWMSELQVLDDDAGLDDIALAVDQQRGLAQRPAVYASPLAFAWRPPAPSGRGRAFTVPKSLLVSGRWRALGWANFDEMLRGEPNARDSNITFRRGASSAPAAERGAASGGQPIMFNVS